MENLLVMYKSRVIIILISAASLLLSANTFGQSPYTSIASGDWAADATWSGAGFPIAGDVVTIAAGHSITFLAPASCASLTFTGGGASSTVTLGAFTLNVSGLITIPRAGGGNSNTLAVGTGTLNAGTIAFTSGGNASNRHRITISSGTVTVTGNVTGTGGNVSGLIEFTGG